VSAPIACQPGTRPRAADSLLKGVPRAYPRLRVLAFALLDLDEVTRIGAVQHLRDVEHLHALERTGHGDSC
jgi:hypothetical protein